MGLADQRWVSNESVSCTPAIARAQVLVTLQLKLSSPKGCARHSSAQKPSVILSCLLNSDQVCPSKFSIISFEVYCLLLVIEWNGGLQVPLLLWVLCCCQGIGTTTLSARVWWKGKDLFKSHTGLEEWLNVTVKYSNCLKTPSNTHSPFSPLWPRSPVLRTLSQGEKEENRSLQLTSSGSSQSSVLSWRASCSSQHHQLCCCDL